MYNIINAETGETIGMTESVTYIRLNSKNGCFVMCEDGETPQGVAYASTPYNLFGKESMGDLPIVIVSEVDGGTEMDALKSENASLSEQLTQAQLALCDVYEQGVTAESQLTETQLALCDMYEQLLALTSTSEGGTV